ncbi:MAG: hypothetical protein KDG55_23755, partial [Rhodocyclaceae bacterium]|nr:hypothetical protein [Rhodocyclaceae bacterium]
TGLSDRNVKRRIDEARHLGAQIVSERRTDDEEGTNFHVYVLQNRDAILAGNFQTWLELERARGREEKPLIAER